ncbi:phosphoribosylglycinamide formyltransferase [Pedococcus bigeumensis]|uniref:Phosphoribosylglycinamide formyltransferase n=1 Tax=Pedococcus bigeumensis TaxID=433644 RepID=A0A502D1V1_9MICO|nr:phosphoribosylglycinamide formyltransferase [Pedococcus bigeumensis]
MDAAAVGRPRLGIVSRVTAPAGPHEPTGIVVLVSGSGTNLQALIDAAADPAYGVRILAVGGDRAGITGLHRAGAAGIPAFVCRVEDHDSRAEWDAALTGRIGDHAPAFVVSAGFMKLLGPEVLGRWTVLNTHPALLPNFPGAHAVRDALAAGATETGCTVHVVDAGVDTGPVLAQARVAVAPDDTEASLHERIKAVEHPLLVEIVGRAAREGITVSDGKATIP